jgi:hypothetical protein
MRRVGRHALLRIRHPRDQVAYYRAETLLGLAGRCGLEAEFMSDWEAEGHRQSKIRVRPRRVG